MTSGIEKGLAYGLTLVTLPVAWLLVRAGQALKVPVEVFWASKAPESPMAPYWLIFVPSIFGVLAIVFGMWALLMPDKVREISRLVAFTLVCFGIVLTGPMLGTIFLAQGLNPLLWWSHPMVWLPVVELVAFGFAVYLVHERITESQISSRMRKYGIGR